MRASYVERCTGETGVATGIGVMAFGGGALLCAPLTEKLLQKYQTLPEMVGTVNTTEILTVAGKRMVEVGGQAQEVVVASANAVKAMPGLVDGGVYLTGTGDTGLGPTFLTLGAMYTGLMMCVYCEHLLFSACLAFEFLIAHGAAPAIAYAPPRAVFATSGPLQPKPDC